ncbi:hypothetical protein CAC42_2388 [Sphaceloma murrayae]|uniref:RRM domain-containing protein n=1 Tax=Sphaceloma murrayae TaxID=2082308 RepID=A0A2K1QVX8_9PEZI|nr:hypothetical protein CAC42_2388 [Sphaceloma murrayae]
MGPKKQQQKMSIGDFLSDQSLGSWADEMETQPMPGKYVAFETFDYLRSDIQQRQVQDSAANDVLSAVLEQADLVGIEAVIEASVAAEQGQERSKVGKNRPRQFREQLPLPTRPPYTAHLGNLSFEVTETDVQGFLSGCDVTSVRIVEDKLDRKPKGFGYVEFGTLEGLKKALTLSETQFQGRNVRISVAEPPKDRGESRELNDWTRKGPLPDLPGQGQRHASERTGGFRSNFDPASDASAERAPRRGGFPDNDGKPRDFGNWERKGPLSPVPGQEPRQGGRGSRDFGEAPERRNSPSWGEGRSEAGSRPPRRDFSERPVQPERTPTAAEQDNQWRARMKPDAPSPSTATPEASVPSSPAAPPKAAERPRLNLTKRTVSEAPTDTPTSGSDSKASPFGAAKPIDTSAREREIEEKRQLAIRQKREADDKVREERKKDSAAKAASSSADGAAPAPRENGTRGSVSERKRSTAQGEDGDEKPKPAQFEILRRMENEEEGDKETPDADQNGDIIGDKETKPQEITREVPQGGDSWRKNDGPADSAEQLEDDGFTVVASNKKGRSNRGNRALAS